MFLSISVLLNSNIDIIPSEISFPVSLLQLSQIEKPIRIVHTLITIEKFRNTTKHINLEPIKPFGIQNQMFISSCHTNSLPITFSIRNIIEKSFRNAFNFRNENIRISECFLFFFIVINF